ncbi:MAG: hypothetical protein MI919_12835 [Holophagales bacterium]|nr:hypothetical protein [Holophagales bacterium]
MSVLDPIRPFVRRHVPGRWLRTAARIGASPERIRYHPWARRLLPCENQSRLEALADRHRGERCFVIGSGPSIKGMDLRPLAEEVTFGFNAFFLVADELGFLPTYYLVEDPLPAEDNAEALNELRGTTKILPRDLGYCLKEDGNTLYVHFDRFYGDHPEPGFPRFSHDAARVVYWGGTVTYMALQLAGYMGFSDIYMLGIDLSYRLPERLEGPRIVSDGDDVNHFHPQYFGKGKRWHDPKVERMQASFEVAERALRERGKRLWNATAGGNLERVPRVPLETALRTPARGPA